MVKRKNVELHGREAESLQEQKCMGAGACCCEKTGAKRCFMQDRGELARGRDSRTSAQAQSV